MLALACAVLDLHLQIGNDVFTDVTPPIDDSGFTNDLGTVAFTCDERYGAALRHRMITERYDAPGYRGRRWDEVDAFATAQLAWRGAVVRFRAGPVLGGNFGGRAIQNGWHALTGTGPTLAEGLQHDYAGDRRIGVAAGANARRTWGSQRLAGYATVDAQGALGQTGVSSFEGGVGGIARLRRLALHAEVVAARDHVGDPNLALPGGYRPGWHVEWRLGAGVAWGRSQLTYEYRADEGGSGEPFATIGFDHRF